MHQQCNICTATRHIGTKYNSKTRGPLPGESEHFSFGVLFHLFLFLFMCMCLCEPMPRVSGYWSNPEKGVGSRRPVVSECWRQIGVLWKHPALFTAESSLQMQLLVRFLKKVFSLNLYSVAF